MKRVSELSYIEIHNTLFGKKVHFTSDCEFFPNFDVVCIIKDIMLSNSEILFDCKVLAPYEKRITIGSNMRNLKYEFV